jgi:hypothetical protein
MPPPAARTASAPSTPCRTCGAPLPAGKALCQACGAANGEGNSCPHCGATADVERDEALGFRCLVCGGPRVAIDIAGVALGPSVDRALTSARRQHRRHLAFSAAGLVLASLGGLGLLIASVVALTTSLGLVPALALLLGAALPLGAGAWALRRAASAREQRGRALHDARVTALANAQAVTGVLDGAQVAEAFRLEPGQAELLLAEASVATLLNEAPAPRLRVAEAAGFTQAGDESAGLALTEPGDELAAAPEQRARKGDTEPGR